MVMRSILYTLDRWLFEALLRNPGRLPPRLQKLVAGYYPDARVRKVYWAEQNVHMGEGTFANPGLLVVNTPDEAARISIGARVSIAPGVILVTNSSPNNSALLRGHPQVRDRLLKTAPITIEEDVWLGAAVVVLPGITIGRGAIVGAGAVVTRNVAPLSIVGGVPARLIRMLPPLPPLAS